MNISIKRLTKQFLVFWLVGWLGLLLVSPIAEPATLVFNGDFESGNLTGWTVDGNTPSVNATAKRSGSFGLQSILSPNMATNYRTELKVAGAAGKFGPETGAWSGLNEYWIGLNVKFVDNNGSGSEISPIQIHTRPKDWAVWSYCTVGSQVDTGSFNALVSNGQFKIVRHNPGTSAVTMYQESIRLGVWYSLVFRYVPSFTSTGIIEVWVDGVKRGSYFGVNSLQKDACATNATKKAQCQAAVANPANCGVDLASPYFQGAGIYKWENKSLPSTQTTPRRELYFDNFKIAKTTVGANDGYNMVAPPGSATVDTTPPTITGVAASNVNNNSATITWTTNEAASSKVDYGLTTGYGLFVSDAALLTSHSINLIDLTPGTLYNYRVSSTDAAGNTGNGANLTFSTTSSDITGPVISNIQTTLTPTSIAATWTTNEAASRRIKILTPVIDPSSKFEAALVTSGGATFTGLTPNTAYTYKLSSVDAAGNNTDQSGLSFTTPDLPADPVLSSIQVTGLTATSATFTWMTNVASDTHVIYGTNQAMISSAGNSTMTTNHSVTVTGLTPNKVYYYQLSSTNASAKKGQSAKLTLTTKTKTGQKTDSFNGSLNPFEFGQPALAILGG